MVLALLPLGGLDAEYPIPACFGRGPRPHHPGEVGRIVRHETQKGGVWVGLEEVVSLEGGDVVDEDVS